MRTNLLILSLIVIFFFACGNNAAEHTTIEQEVAEPVAVNVPTYPEEKPIANVATPVAKEKENIATPTSDKMTKPTAPVATPQAPEPAPAKQAAEQEQKNEPAPLDQPLPKPASPAAPAPTDVEQTTASRTTSDNLQPAAPSHSIWNVLLQKYVNSAGRVNYAGLKKDMAKLQQYLDLLSDSPPQPSWSRNEEMAFWINAYNAFTVKLILDHYPVKSIKDLHNGQPWKVQWIKIGNKTYSLDEIENSILRPKFKDARIHFAVNCAALSCPPLLNQAWTAQNLEDNFEQQARNFINNPAFNKIAPNAIQVSKIFEWYAQDFGNLISFLNRYSKITIKPGAKVSYLEYNWSLNAQ